MTGTLTFSYLRLPARLSTFTSDLLAAGPDRLILANDISPSAPLLLHDEVVLASGYHAVWFLFKNHPYDVARVYRPDGAFTGYYVDVLETIQWQDSDPNTLHPLVDLFLDLWIEPDGSYHVLDQDEFDAAAASGVLTAAQALHAREVLDRLIAQVRAGTFPPVAVRSFERGSGGVDG